MNKSIIYLLYFAAYSILLLFFGKSGFKKTNNGRDFFVAGNSLGLAASIFSFCATWFSSASVQGVTGYLYAYGYSAILYSVVPWFLGASLLVLMAPKLKEYDILTIPEFFNLKYKSKYLQAMGGIMVLITYTLYITIQIRGFGIVISELLGISYLFAIFLIYLFVVYTTFGGMYSVNRAHILNFVLVVVGVIIASAIVLNNVGGIYNMHVKAYEVDTRPFADFLYKTEKGGLLDPFAKGQIPPIVIFTNFFGWGLGISSTPQHSIRIVSANNTKTAVKTIWYSILILSVLYLGLTVIGVGGRVLVPEILSIRSMDEVFPYMINNIIYSPLSGLILIGIVAASISAATTQLLLASSGFTYDFYKNLINPSISDDNFLNLNRFFIFAVGTVSLITAVNPPESLLFYGGYLWGFFSSSFLIPLYGGLFWKKATKEGAIASFLTGSITMSFLLIKDLGSINPAFPSVIVSALSFYFVSIYYHKEGRALK